MVVSYKGEVFIKNLAIAPPSQAEAYDNTILRARHLRAPPPIRTSEPVAIQDPNSNRSN